MPLIRHRRRFGGVRIAAAHQCSTAIDLEIEEGEFVCVLGQTGCGKSTLLRLVLGAEQPQRGRMLIDGREHHSARPHRAATCRRSIRCSRTRPCWTTSLSGRRSSEFSLVRAA